MEVAGKWCKENVADAENRFMQRDVVNSDKIIKYRADIDGLRALSVLAVVFFHSGSDFLSGGYIGVDIFFVISGYLITSLLYDEIKAGTFTFAGFYKRRVARLLPALCITLFVVLGFGFVFYDSYAFNNLGKETLFSALGLVNILFAQGVDYFAQEESVRPLIHIWSLGVEEQFYLIWPLILLMMAALTLRNALILVAVLIFSSFYLAVISNETEPVATYFYPQYRAFELLIGAFTALMVRHNRFRELTVSKGTREFISVVAIAMMAIPMLLLSRSSVFPGLNTLWPCVGTALFIAFACNSTISRILSWAPVVFIGLISYPLYLYHQPVISYLHLFSFGGNSFFVMLISLLIATPLAWLTYKYIEKPLRKMAHNKDKPAAIYIFPLISCLALLAVAGTLVAKSDGFEARFKLLNPFAYEVSQHNTLTFADNFKRGFNVAAEDSGRILFIGDSLLQQYVYPISRALGIATGEVDTVTRGGCVLLKGVQFKDEFADISCNDLRDRLYKLQKQYDYVVISQSWNGYDSSILNSSDKDPLKKWQPFLKDTIDYFKPFAGNIIVIGSHLYVTGTADLRPTMFLSRESYLAGLDGLKVVNQSDMEATRWFFEQWRDDSVTVLHPLDLWLDRGSFVLHDNNWSYFVDTYHISRVSTEYVIRRLDEIYFASWNRKRRNVAKTTER